MINAAVLSEDYEKAQPENNSYLMNYYYNVKLPKQGSFEYYKFLELLKLLEIRQQFSRDGLEQFVVRS